MAFSVSIGLYTARILMGKLGVNDYGIYSVVGGFVGMMGFLGTVMASSSHRFITISLTRNKRLYTSKIFSACFWVHLVLVLVTFTIGESFGVYYINNYLNVLPNRLGDVNIVYQISLLSVVCSIIIIPFQALLTAFENFSFLAFTGMGISIATLVLVIFLSHYNGDGLIFYSVGILIINFLNVVGHAFFCMIKYPVKLIKVKDKGLFYQIFTFSGWIMLGAGAYVGQNQGSAVLLNSFFGTTVNAAFGISSQVNNQIVQFSQNVNRAFIPQITKSVGQNDLITMSKLVCSSSKLTFFMMYLVSFPILLETDFILKLWLHTYPPFTATFCQLMLLVALFESADAGIPAAIQATGKIKYFQLLYSLISISTLPIAYLLFRNHCPPYYITFSYLLTTILIFCLKFYMLKKVLNFDLIELVKSVYIKVLIVVIPTLWIFFLRNHFEQSLSRFIYISGIAVVSCMFLIFAFGLTSPERHFLLMNIKKRFQKL